MNNVEAESTVEVGLLPKPLADFFKCLTNTEACCNQCKEKHYVFNYSNIKFDNAFKKMFL